MSPPASDPAHLVPHSPSALLPPPPSSAHRKRIHAFTPPDHHPLQPADQPNTPKMSRIQACLGNLKHVKENLEVEAPTLAELIQFKKSTDEKTASELLVVDCRRFIDYNTSHIRSAVNICCSKLVRRRLQENKMNALDLLLQQLSACGLNSNKDPDNLEVILYDQQTLPDPPTPAVSKQPPPPSKVIREGSLPESQGSKSGVTKLMSKSSSLPCSFRKTGAMDDSTFVNILIEKLSTCAQLASVKILKGGFLDFQARYPELCEGAAPIGGIPATPGRGASARLSVSSLSQPCMPVSNQGPTRILPFLYLGSQQDALDREVLSKHGINYVLNLSISCPRPDFLAEENFLRIPVNDSYTEKLLPHFEAAFDFLDKVREANAIVIVHCLAGISRSPTLAIAYIMRHLHMTSEEAYRYIKEKRPSISPNFNFLGQLLEYEKLLKARLGKEVQEQLKGSLRKVLVPPIVSPRPATARQESERTKEAPTLARTNSFPLDCPGMKRSFSCPVKIQRLGEPISRPEQTRMEVDPAPNASPSSLKNQHGKRVMRPSGLSVESVDSAATAPKVIDMTRSPTKQAVNKNWPIQPPTAPVSLTLSAPKRTPEGAQSSVSSQVQRPRGLGGLRARCALNIPQPVQEDLPSPSTELSRSFGGALALGGSKIADAPEVIAEERFDDPSEKMEDEPVDNNSNLATPAICGLEKPIFPSLPPRAIDSTSAVVALRPEKVQSDAGRDSAFFEASPFRFRDPPQTPALSLTQIDTFSSSTDSAAARGSQYSTPSAMCATNPFFAAMVACGGVSSFPSPEFETPPEALPPSAIGGGSFSTYQGCDSSSLTPGTQSESSARKGIFQTSADEYNKRDSGVDPGRLSVESPSFSVVQITEPTPSVVTTQPRLSREPSEVESSNPMICAAENPFFARESRKSSSFGASKCRADIVIPDDSSGKVDANRPRSSSLEKPSKIRSKDHQKLSRRIGNFLRARSSLSNAVLPFFGAAAVSGRGGTTAGSGSGNIFGTYLMDATRTTAASARSGSGVSKSATSGGISSSQLSPQPPKSKSETALLYSMVDLDSPESGFVESPMRDQVAPHSPYAPRDPDTTSIGSTSSLEIAVN